MTPAIQIENFSYHYPDHTQALVDINLVIEPGCKAALIGPNGAGKSTLLLALSAFIKGTGKITIDGLELSKNTREVRRLLGSVLANPDEQLFMPTLFDDVAFGPLNMGLGPDQIQQRTNRALETVGLAAMANRPPHHLSAGQKRSAAIATILSMSPKIITMDEPDSSLDPKSRNKLLELLSKLPQTFVVATCNMNFAASLCSRAILLDNGRVIADGGAKEIMTDQELMLAHGLEVPTAAWNIATE